MKKENDDSALVEIMVPKPTKKLLGKKSKKAIPQEPQEPMSKLVRNTQSSIFSYFQEKPPKQTPKPKEPCEIVTSEFVLEDSLTLEPVESREVQMEESSVEIQHDTNSTSPGSPIISILLKHSDIDTPIVSHVCFFEDRSVIFLLSQPLDRLEYLLFDYQYNHLSTKAILSDRPKAKNSQRKIKGFGVDNNKAFLLDISTSTVVIYYLAANPQEFKIYKVQEIQSSSTDAAMFTPRAITPPSQSNQDKQAKQDKGKKAKPKPSTPRIQNEHIIALYGNTSKVHIHRLSPGLSKRFETYNTINAEFTDDISGVEFLSWDIIAIVSKDSWLKVFHIHSKYPIFKYKSIDIWIIDLLYCHWNGLLMFTVNFPERMYCIKLSTEKEPIVKKLPHTEYTTDSRLLDGRLFVLGCEGRLNIIAGKTINLYLRNYKTKMKDTDVDSLVLLSGDSIESGFRFIRVYVDYACKGKGRTRDEDGDLTIVAFLKGIRTKDRINIYKR